MGSAGVSRREQKTAGEKSVRAAECGGADYTTNLVCLCVSFVLHNLRAAYF